MSLESNNYDAYRAFKGSPTPVTEKREKKMQIFELINEISQDSESKGTDKKIIKLERLLSDPSLATDQKEIQEKLKVFKENYNQGNALSTKSHPATYLSAKKALDEIKNLLRDKGLNK